MKIKIPQELIDEGYISVDKHEECDYFLYNYTNKCVYDRKWNEYTMACRGLILNAKNVVISRPFMKFFNLSEYNRGNIEQDYIDLNKPCEVYEKIDGSCIILYHMPNGEPRLTTRGSFTSEQAKKAQEIFDLKYREFEFDTDYTFIFEVVYPSNRIVIDYGNMEELVLLGAINKETGEEAPFTMLQEYSLLMSVPLVEPFNFANINEVLQYMKQDPEGNTEGFVVKFSDGLRVKIKYDEYCRLHKLVTGVNAKTIWEILKEGKNLEELLSYVPDEFYKWVEETTSELNMKYAGIEYACETIIMKELDRNWSIKEVANYFINKYPDLSSVLFAMYRDKPYKDIIWKMIKPINSKAFKCDGEKYGT